MRRAGRRLSLILVAALLAAVATYGATVAVRVVVLDECLEEHLPGLVAPTRPSTTPYLQDVTTTSAALLWWTSTPRGATLRYGVAPTLTETLHLPPAPRQEVALTGLTPATTYVYAVTPDGQTPMGGSFQTAPGPDATITIGVIGDSGDGGGAQQAVADLLTGLAPDLVLHTGDVVYPHGGLCRYEERFFTPYADLLATVPFYPTVGNHDLAAENGAAYVDVFRLPAATPTGGERYYALDAGPARVLVLDAEALLTDDGASPAAVAQLAWLDAELASNRDRLPWTIALLHRPLVSSAGNHLSDGPIERMLAQRFAAGGVDLVLSGHVHAYERAHPRDGVTYVVSGGGGAGLHHVEAGGEIAVAASVYHALRLTISPERLTIEAIATRGQVIDHFGLERAP